MDYAKSMVGDALAQPLHALFQNLLDALALPFGVEKEAKKLESILEKIKALLTDAEERQIKEESVRLWLIDLKHVAYDAEDILDELEYKALGSRIEEAPIQTRKRKRTDQFWVTHFFSRFCSKFELGSRIKKIGESLDEIERESNQLRLKVIYGSQSKRLRMRDPSSSSIDESSVFGREADREKVVGLLALDDSSAANSGIQVVPICGMGGLGKTTLAQLIRKDERVKNYFDVSAWVYVSEDFDLMKLTKAIAESVTGSACLLTNLDAIQVSVQNALNGKKFFLVLDDVWNVNYNRWDALRAPLMVAGRGSRILVTTRSHRVSSMMGTVPTYSLQCLSDDDCWSIFKQLAFVEGDSDVHPDLVKIGKEIVNKCKGLPLAVKTIGGLLRSKVTDWKSILESEIWELPEEGNDILPALRLSYHHLPAHLKRCFEFCSIFPKGSYTFYGQEFVWSWMALGFIQSEGSKDMEDIGKEYLADLVSRSLLYKERFDVRMHDLIHDLARSVLGAEILEIGDQKSHKNAEKVRHVSCKLSSYSAKSFNFEYLYCFKSLRTLKLVGDTMRYGPVLTIPPDLFVNLRHIRILDLTGNHITELPESIGNLIQLRYLDLSNTSIERLPKSITKLYNLQTLMLEECSKLVEVPSDFSNLVNLRNLNLRGCSACIPFGRLKSLRNLDRFKIRREIGYGVNELRDMIHLRGYLRISKLENVVSVEEAKEAELKKKQKIHGLELKWESDDVDSRQEGIEEEVLNALQPHTNLETLEIVGYCGVRFPTWLGDSSFSKLVRIQLYKCKCPILPPFGQLPCLETLRLENLYGLERVERDVYGDGMVKGFPSLKMLFVANMPDLEEWTALEGDMIHLREINIKNCSKLRVLPDIFPRTPERVYIEQCKKLATLPRVSAIRDLYLYSCDERILRSLQHLTSLSTLHVSDFPTLTSLGVEVLPATLQCLKIFSCSNLNCLPTGLKNLTSLADLRLYSCPRIHFLPEELPTSALVKLVIHNCPLVTEKCKEGGEYWSKISHIPHIDVYVPRIDVEESEEESVPRIDVEESEEEEYEEE